MRVRDPTPADASALADFKCANTTESWDLSVEEYVHNALAWAAEDPSHQVKVVEDDDGEIMAVIGYQPNPPGRPEDGYWFGFMAVPRHRQGEGIGPVVFDSLVAHLGTLAPGAPLGWAVHVRNFNSQKMCNRLLRESTPEDDPDLYDDVPWSDPRRPDHLTYSLYLPEPALGESS